MTKRKYNNPVSADLSMVAGRVHQAVNRINVIGDMDLTVQTAEKMQEMMQKIGEIDKMVDELFSYSRKAKR